MSKLDLEWLAVFAEVYKTASVSKDAEQLGLAEVLLQLEKAQGSRASFDAAKSRQRFASA